MKRLAKRMRRKYFRDSDSSAYLAPCSSHMPIFPGLHYSTEYHFLRRKSREENGSRHEGKRDRKETTGQMRTELPEGHQALEGTLQLIEEQHENK